MLSHSGKGWGLLDNMCFADVQEPCPFPDLLLPVSQECPFLIVSLVYFTYFQFTRRCRKMYISKLSIQKMVRNAIHMSYIGCSFPQPKKTPPKQTNEQHYVIKFVIDLRQVGGFLRVLRFPPPIKLTATI